MENIEQQPVQAGERKKMSGLVVAVIIILIVAAAIAAAWWVFSSSATTLEPAMVPSAPTLRISSSESALPPSENTASVNQAFEGIGSDALDEELRQIDQELKNL